MSDPEPATTPWRGCYRTTAGDVRFGLDGEAIAAALDTPGGLLWVDLDLDDRAQNEQLLARTFGFHHLTIDDCFNLHIDPPKVDDYGDYLFVIVHAVSYDDRRTHLETRELNLYIGERFVVSAHKGPLHAADAVWMRAQNHTPVMNRGAAFLAHALIDVVVDDFHPIVEIIDDEVAELEERVLRMPGRQTLQLILHLKRVTQRLRRSISPQRDVVNRFSRGEYPRLIPEDALMYFRDVYDHTLRVQDTIDSVRDLADSTLNTYLSAVNNRINEVMKILAIVTVIFLPLTLIASIYGTNFEETFPSYSFDSGFAGMMLTMLAIALALAAFFKWRRWF